MISEKFINECKNRANANRLGKIIIDDIEKTITNSDNLQSYSVDSGCYVDGNIIGSVYAKCLKADFITDIADLSEKTIHAQIGVKYADNSTEYVSIGKYRVERPNNEITANMSQITAYDDLYTNLDNKYVCGIDYSKGNITVKDLYIDVCKQLGLTPKTTSFLNDNIPIEDNPFTNGEKNRTVLQTVCKISCSFVDIDIDTDEIDLCWLSQNKEPDYIFYKNDYVSVEGGQVVCGPINCLIIKNSKIDSENVTKKDDKDIAINGEHSITISEDYILHNEELRQLAINNIWDRIHGMKYVDCKLTTDYGKPFLKLGYRIRIYTDEDVYFDTYVLKHKFTYDGSFSSIIESPALTQQEIKSKQDISLGQALLNTQIDVDKQNKRINALVSEQTETSEKVTNLELNLNGIDATVKSQSTTITELQKGQQTLEKDLSTTNSNLDKTNENVSNLDKKIDGVSANFEDFKDNEYIKSIENLQDQIDGAIQFWNGAEIPTINNYPASDWTTENDRNNHRADIYTVIEDVEGELKQGKSYRFDKVNGVWQWIELTDNELSAVQALAEKAQKAADKAQETADEANNRSKENSTSITKLQETDVELKLGLDSIDERVHTTETITSDLKPTDEARGTELVLKKSAGMTLLEFEAEGNVRQKTRSGINQLMSFKKDERDFFYSISNTTNSDTYFYKATPLEENWVKFECDLTGSTDDAIRYINEFIRIEKIPNIKTSTQYTIVCEFRNVNITTMQNNFNIGKTSSTEQDLIFLSAFNCNSTDIKKGLKKYLLTTCDDFGNNFIALRNFHILSPGDKFSYECRMSVLEGDYTNKDYEYEEFGVMPSPEFPSEIKSIKPLENLFTFQKISKVNSAITISNQDDNNITLYSKGQSAWQTIEITLDNFEKNKNYNISFNQVNSLTGLTNWLNIRGLDSENNSTDIINKGFNTNDIVQEYNTSNYEKIVVSFYCLTTASVLGENTANIKNVMIKPSNIDYSYVPYGHWLPVNVMGENLYNYKDVSGISNSTADDDGWITMSYDNSSGTNAIYCNYPTNPSKNIKLDGHEYLIVLEVKNVEGTGDFALTSSTSRSVAQFNGKAYKFSDLKSGDIIFFKDTTISSSNPNIKHLLRTFAGFNVGQSGSITFRISVLKDTTITEENFVYEPFKEEQLNIDFKDNFVGKLTDEIKDRLYYQNRHLYIEKQVGRAVIDGKRMIDLTDVITAINLKALAFYPPNKKEQYNTNAYCDRARFILSSSSYWKPNTFYENISNFVFIGTEDDTLESLQAKFNGGLLYYALETPEIIDLGEYDLSTFKDTNYIQLISKLETELYCKYARYTEAQEIYQTKDGMLDYYNKYETDTQILLSKNEIESHVQEMRTLVDENGQALSQVQNQVQQVTTSTNQQLNVLEERIENGVDKVVTKTGYTFDINGLSIASNLDKFKSLITNKYILVSSSDKEIAFFGYDDNLGKTIARINELESKKVKGGYHRWEGFIDENGEKRSGWFYDGGDD